MKDIYEIIKFVFPFWKKYWVNEIFIFTILAFSLVVNLNIPLYFKETIDSIANFSNKTIFEKNILILVALSFLSSTIVWLYRVYITKIGESVIIDITSFLYSQILDNRRKFWETYSQNDILTRLTQDVLSVKSFIFDFMHGLLLNTVTLISITMILFTMSFYAVIIVVIQILFIVFIAYWGNNFLTKNASFVRTLSSSFTDLFQKGISFPAFNFSWGIKKYHFNKYYENATLMRSTQVKFVNQIEFVSLLFSTLNIIFGVLALLIVLRFEIQKFSISIGTFMAILIYANSCITTASSLTNSIISTKISRTSVLRIREILNYKTDSYKLNLQNSHPIKIVHPYFKGKLKEGIELPNSTKYIYHLEAENGSGKSTLAAMLSGFDDISRVYFEEGFWFLINDNPPVYEGSLIENIRIISGKNITEDFVTKILNSNQMDALLQVFPSGFETQIASHSQLISQGQKQSLQLIALIVKDPSNLIIDEALNSIDKNIRNEIIVGFNKWLKDRKSIVIDHNKIFGNLI